MKNDFLPYLDEVGKIYEDSEDESYEVAEDLTTKEKKKRQKIANNGQSSKSYRKRLRQKCEKTRKKQS